MTLIFASADDGNIIFTNSLGVTSRINHLGLITSGDVDIAVQCAFEAVVSDITSNLAVQSPTHTSGTSGTGHFAFVANYYTTAAYDTLSTENDTMVVGEILSFGISPTTLINDVRFYVDDCTVSDSNNSSFAILDNMCPNNFVVKSISNFINTEMFQMNYHAFTFAGKLF